jgi:hypothetical protein
MTEHVTLKNTEVLKTCTAYHKTKTIEVIGTIGRGTYCSEALYNMQYRHITFQAVEPFVGAPHYLV